MDSNKKIIIITPNNYNKMDSNKKIIIITPNITPVKIIEKDFGYYFLKKRKYSEINTNLKN